MRLDKFLKVNRIIKRRTIAQEVSKAGLVKKDGRPLKPSYEVKPGDVLEITYGTRFLKIKVTEDLKYEVIEEKKEQRGAFDEEFD
ncbi:S4 domain-containing protein [Fervidobacterium thailandense]|uniref:RNA-binding protein n=1 Tax=Fervidobacterium thailandense TaxID=1008305 RepID=A0A1E3G095_9BACT|nr:S4 domain-containing protein [Fervidobacterium thailandense]ODN29659.1 RNA-binding protein [Fervidobacterium thailandense]